jgi:hypothetical protein
MRRKAYSDLTNPLPARRARNALTRLRGSSDCLEVTRTEIRSDAIVR